MILKAAGAALCASAAVMAYGVRGRSSTLFGPSVWRGASARRAVALTFDDGPSEATPQLLDLLARYGARATFFQCGTHVRRLPDITRQVAAAGHQIGNHGDTHSPFYLRPAAFIYEELRRAQEAIEAAAGLRPVLFRAPYGCRWFGLREAQRRLGLLGVMWTVLGLDWKRPGDWVARRLIRRASPGAILCLHDGRRTLPHPDITSTLEAVRRLIPALQAQGYQFHTVSEILRP